MYGGVSAICKLKKNSFSHAKVENANRAAYQLKDLPIYEPVGSNTG